VTEPPLLQRHRINDNVQYNGSVMTPVARDVFSEHLQRGLGNVPSRFQLAAHHAVTQPPSTESRLEPGVLPVHDVAALQLNQLSDREWGGHWLDR